MKSDYFLSFIKDAGSSNGLTANSTDAIATSIAQLMVENEALRRLAALLTSQLDLERGLAAAQDQPSSR
jgi:hypothetical protein